MAEGATLPWKVQKIDESRGPPADFSSIHKPLPDPPKGTSWKHDKETKEWRIVPYDGVGKQIVSNACDQTAGKAEPSLVPAEQQEGSADTSKKLIRSLSSALGKEDAVEGVDYVEHTVLPSDTLSGLCLRYKVTATKVRQTNRFSGSNLLLAPSKLIIPLGKVGLDGGRIRLQDKNSPEFKLHSFLAVFPHLRIPEARAYLELADWDLESAIKEANEDAAWEMEKKREEQNARMSKFSDLNLEVYEAIPAPPPKEDARETRETLTAPLLRRTLELSKIN